MTPLFKLTAASKVLRFLTQFADNNGDLPHSHPVILSDHVEHAFFSSLLFRYFLYWLPTGTDLNTMNLCSPLPQCCDSFYAWILEYIATNPLGPMTASSTSISQITKCFRRKLSALIFNSAANLSGGIDFPFENPVPYPEVAQRWMLTIGDGHFLSGQLTSPCCIWFAFRQFLELLQRIFLTLFFW